MLSYVDVKCIYMNRIVRVHALLILINSVKCVAIHVKALIGCDREERALC